MKAGSKKYASALCNKWNVRRASFSFFYRLYVESKIFKGAQRL